MTPYYMYEDIVSEDATGFPVEIFYTGVIDRINTQAVGIKNAFFTNFFLKLEFARIHFNGAGSFANVAYKNEILRAYNVQFCVAF